MKKVVVVLPVLNEEGAIEKTITEVLGQQKNLLRYELEILIVVDNTSTDKTEEKAKKLALRNKKIHVVVVGHGLGVALIEGHKFSLSHLYPDVLAQIDADGQVEPEILPRLVKAIDEGYDLALGSRFVPGGKNKLSPSRRLFSFGLSVFCRVVMGPFSIGEFANSARAFTPALFKKINLERMPWREKTFIVQPSFLHEAILAGAKYKEVPLVFKNRAEGYSKNKIFNYTYDVITYALDARLHEWGIKIPFFRISGRAKTVVKFGLVGFVGTLVDFFFYKLFINIGGIPPATSKGFSTEIAIINNFLLNNYWTFRYRKTKTSFLQKFGIFNLVSLGGLIIGVLIVKFLHNTYGDFFAYFHSGDNIHLAFPPFQVFNKNQFWVGDIWLEDIVYIFILGFLGAVTLFKQKLYPLAFFVLTYLAASILVPHRDISRYVLPIAPFVLIAFEKVLTSQEFKIVLIIIAIGIYLYAQNFILANVAPYPNPQLFN